MSCAFDDSRSLAPVISLAEVVAERRRRSDEIVGTERRVSYFQWKANFLWLRIPVSASEARFIAANPVTFENSLHRVCGFELNVVIADLPEGDPERRGFAVVGLYDWDLGKGCVEVQFEVDRHTGDNDDGSDYREYHGNVTPEKGLLYRARWAFID